MSFYCGEWSFKPSVAVGGVAGLTPWVADVGLSPHFVMAASDTEKVDREIGVPFCPFLLNSFHPLPQGSQNVRHKIASSTTAGGDYSISLTYHVRKSQCLQAEREGGVRKAVYPVR